MSQTREGIAQEEFIAHADESLLGCVGGNVAALKDLWENKRSAPQVPSLSGGTPAMFAAQENT